MTPFEEWREINGPPPCVGHIECFFPWDGQVGHSEQRTRLEYEARNICNGCSGKALCFQASIVEMDGRRYVEPGIWAGLTQVERCARTGLNPVPSTGTRYANQVAVRARTRR